ncbi:hypothetical protein GDO81_019753 [Engystomops pustulosus]|uniref:Uncharacterized protein n=1 Tax=Engystomops pustulosus TaxID=76066 RepID=A0AAV6Z2K9_ENGPU|nr:hypothetical protein GDO81_019753 [Engystomops pustulosus]
MWSLLTDRGSTMCHILHYKYKQFHVFREGAGSASSTTIVLPGNQPPTSLWMEGVTEDVHRWLHWLLKNLLP